MPDLSARTLPVHDPPMVVNLVLTPPIVIDEPWDPGVRYNVELREDPRTAAVDAAVDRAMADSVYPPGSTLWGLERQLRRTCIGLGAALLRRR